MTQDELATFHDSLERCHQDPTFLPRFYQRVMSSSQEIAARFSHTDMRRQYRILAASLYEMLGVVSGSVEGQAHAAHLARVHDHEHHDVAPWMYDVWLDCLVSAVRDCDPRCDAHVEAAWRDMLTPAIETMKAAY